MQSIDWAFFRTLTVGLGGFGLAGLVIGWMMPTMRVAIVVDRAFCAPNQWQSTTATYRDRYQAHQQKAIKIERVILVGDLGEERLPQLPTPEDFAKIATFGRSNRAALAKWQQSQPQSPDLQGIRIQMLGCGEGTQSTPQ
ncbi:MAG: hypothetical protein EA001_03870 [Oscillatoriales cyanobacterium]|nr:MAG: hypothetical protein EA001_03870 [Oscillatoriales cyanobacterium]